MSATESAVTNCRSNSPNRRGFTFGGGNCSSSGSTKESLVVVEMALLIGAEWRRADTALDFEARNFPVDANLPIFEGFLAGGDAFDALDVVESDRFVAFAVDAVDAVDAPAEEGDTAVDRMVLLLLSSLSENSKSRRRR